MDSLDTIILEAFNDLDQELSKFANDIHICLNFTISRKNIVLL